MSEQAEKIGALTRRWDVFRNDLRLFAALYVAHFIVWRELRRLHRAGGI
jgi:hypothetical protein